MSRALIILHDDDARTRARRWIDAAPPGTRVEYKRPGRSLDQNSKLWAMLTEISSQLVWHGQRYSPDDYKDFFVHALRKGRWMPGEDGGMIPIGWRTSDLSKEEFSELLELIAAFAARHGVTFRDQEAA